MLSGNKDIIINQKFREMKAIKGKTAQVDDRQLTGILLNDISEMDGDVFSALVEYLYPVTAEYSDGLVQLTAKDGLNLEDIF